MRSTCCRNRNSDDRGADPTHVHGKQGGTRLPACVPFPRGRPGTRQAGTRACAADAPRLRESGQRHCGDRRGNPGRDLEQTAWEDYLADKNKISTLPMTYCRRWSSNDRRDDDSSAGAAPRLRGLGGTGIGEARLDRGGLHPSASPGIPQRSSRASPNARLIGIDRDTEALALATKRMEMEGLADRFTPVHAAFDDFLPSAFRPRRRQGQRGVHGPRIVQPADR